MANIRFIAPRVHAMVDYLIGVALLLAPNLLGFADAEYTAVWVPRVAGLLILALAALTNWSLGLLRVIPLSTHLIADYAIGALLAVSPWLLGFADNPANAWLPHVIVGALIVGVALLTAREPSQVAGAG